MYSVEYLDINEFGFVCTHTLLVHVLSALVHVEMCGSSWKFVSGVYVLCNLICKRIPCYEMVKSQGSGGISEGTVTTKYTVIDAPRKFS